ncbi:NAD(P)H-dependent oxidoreductase [Pseudodonghicola xiamenensis]|uniref:FMN reductase (NADPH) n=1 Tax=Pseudodonghicola xiamenensis TaxID=337702 RepID=A0A8J3H8P3_9RHOB|nr:NAD(P)H-dependent oxidoreductase [Pseudodonghicola xiamenensis]GHG94178.1 FMN reductase (NADPH) [Pseudodonghicola xiamenensis]
MTEPLNLFAFSGSHSSNSKTAILIDAVVEEIARTLPIRVTSANIAPFMDNPLGQRRKDLPETARAILDGIENADLLVMGSPVYKGSYSGAFKHVIDMIEPEGLLHKPVLLCAAGGGQRHALMVEHQLRPLFGFFGAASAPIAIYASAADFTEDKITDPALQDRIRLAVKGFAQMVNTI